MSDRLNVDQDEPLLPFLGRRLSSWKRNTLKQRLARGCVSVNDVVVTSVHHALQVGDVVTIGEAGTAPARSGSGKKDTLVRLFVDDDLVAIDKPAGLLSVSTDREKHKTALAQVRESLGKSARLWPVNRLDRETSGVLLFARSREMREAVQDAWAEADKRYAVVVEGCPEQDSGVIDQPLWEDRALNVQVGENATAKDARTRWEVESRHGPLTLLTVHLDTGRKHQIRAHLRWLGFPVIGDARYGSREAKRLGLHAFRLDVTHPRTGVRLQLSAPLPTAFVALYKKAPSRGQAPQKRRR